LTIRVRHEFRDELRAFAMIESNENTDATGDGGCAFGLLQMHPATFKRCYGSQIRFAPSPDRGADQGLRRVAGCP
jgi:hypothetical protein